MDITTQTLNENELDELNQFLSSDDMPESAMDMSMLDGFFAALVLNPQLINPGEYFHWIWDSEKGVDEPVLDNTEIGNRILDLIIQHYNSVHEAIENDQYEPMFFTLAQEDGSEFLDAEGWCKGFMLGTNVSNDPWDDVFKNHPALVSPMVLLGTEAGWELLDKSKDMKRATQGAYESIAERIKRLYEYFLEQREAATEERMAKSESVPLTVCKTGRNDACPCGSGKKFKKCCGAPTTLH